MEDTAIGPQAKGGVTEKITVNLGVVDLGQIDLLVQQGFYSNRTDFVRTAVRNLLGAHAEALSRMVSQHALVLGLQHYSRRDLETAHAAGRELHLQVLGLLSLAEDIGPDLARDTIASVRVLGAFHASPTLKAALADRIR